MTRRWLWIAGLVAVVVAGAYVGAARRSTGPPLDPSSTAPDGTRALVELVTRLGGTVDIVDGTPADDVDVALLVEDRLSREEADALVAWVRRGGRLVVADPTSLLTPPVADGAVGAVEGDCPFAPLEPVEVIDVGVSRTYELPAGASGCFTAGSGRPVVVVEDVGQGTTISVGGPDLFTNDLLDDADNAVFVAGLLAGPGRRVAFVRPGLAGGGDAGLVDLVGTPVRAGLAQLLVAFVVVVAWRSRRLGRPVEEPQPVHIEGSELTRALGRLLAANRRPDRAAAILRDRARRDLSAPLGIDLDASVATVTAAIATGTELTDDEIHRAVAGPVDGDDDLVDVARLLVRIREEITHERSTTVTS